MRIIDRYRRIILAWLGLVCLLTLSLAQADVPERIEWKKEPIRLALTVGQEQRIEFPTAVKVGVPATIQPLLRTQSIDGTVYLLAHAPFDSSRLMVRELDSGRIYLFDVEATKEGGASHPIQIHVGETATADDVPAEDPDADRIDYVQLTRFAAQQLYAPSRLLKEHPGIVRIPVRRDPVDLIHGGAIEARPLVAWRAGGRFITAVKLTNRTDQAQTLDPRDLRGTWLTATFQNHRLLPRGDEADTTAVYLISARPFEASL